MWQCEVNLVQDPETSSGRRFMQYNQDAYLMVSSFFADFFSLESEPSSGFEPLDG